LGTVDAFAEGEAGEGSSPGREREKGGERTAGVERGTGRGRGTTLKVGEGMEARVHTFRTMSFS
jgi:hypothetical protein